MGIPSGFVFWAPRLFTMALAAFLSLFALDVVGAYAGIWETLFALAMHLVPVFVLIGVLVLAWRHEWVGAVLFAALGLGFVLGPLQPPAVRHGPLHRKVVADLALAGPVFLIAALFFLGWRRRRDGLTAAPR